MPHVHVTYMIDFFSDIGIILMKFYPLKLYTMLLQTKKNLGTYLIYDYYYAELAAFPLS
jgi:hypothetical protein